MKRDPIYVTRPLLPPLDEFVPYLKRIWDSKVLTNGGPLHQELEERLCQYLNVPYISLFANGTIALVTALQALEIRGEVITTPYSFVATAHSLLWNNLTPVFVDIDPDTLNLDPGKIEAAITERTTAILPVHCYGTPCDVHAIDQIASANGLKVLYDAAHAFGVRTHASNILCAGDLSVLSFHATKVFNTLEGGAIISRTKEMKQHVDHLKNFGFVSETEVVEVGINGKMNELQAAFGLLQLKYVDAAIQRRAEIAMLYRELLNAVSGIRCLEVRDNVLPNNSYFPIFVEDEYPISRDDLYEVLRGKGVYARRYFYPLIPSLGMYMNMPSADTSRIPNAVNAATKVLCLPIYPSLEDTVVRNIALLVKSAR